MKMVFSTLLSIVLAGICAWFLALNTCLNLLNGFRAFDFLCGHNVLLQVLPLFVLFIVLFTVLSRILARRWSASSRPGGVGGPPRPR
jgi:hypothetical protein